MFHFILNNCKYKKNNKYALDDYVLESISIVIVHRVP